MKLLWILSLSILTLSFCKGQKKTARFINQEKYNQALLHSHNTLGEKYEIKEYVFDDECIHGKSDLTELVKAMLDLGQFQYEFIEDGLRNEDKQYYSVFKIDQVKYTFETSSFEAYWDSFNIFGNLNRIVEVNKPEYEYNCSNAQYGGWGPTHLIFAKISDLILAVEEGYPCLLDGNQWYWGAEWPWSVYSDIEMEKIPNFEDLKVKYSQTIKKLYEEGFDVPKVSAPRIYIDNILKKNSLDIVIDGVMTDSNKVIRNKIRCISSSWSVVLAYTLVKHYGGKPTLYDSEQKVTTKLTPQEYISKAEFAFGRRK